MTVGSIFLNIGSDKPTCRNDRAASSDKSPRMRYPSGTDDKESVVAQLFCRLSPRNGPVQAIRIGPTTPGTDELPLICSNQSAHREFVEGSLVKGSGLTRRERG